MKHSKIKNSLPNILIVDDIPENLMFIQGILEGMEINLIKALSGQEALNKTKGLPIALAIIDVRMPEMNGYELAERINSRNLEESIPIIFITANNYIELEVIKGYKSGAVDYIYKPVSATVLKSKVQVFTDLFNQKQTILNYSNILKKSKNKAEEIANRFSKVTEIGNTFVWETNQNGNITYISDSVFNVTGFDFSVFTNKHFADNTLPQIFKNRSVINKLEGNIKNDDSDIINITEKITNKNGNTVFLNINAEPHFENGEFTGYNGMCADITKLKLTESKLRDSQDELSRLNVKISNLLEEQNLKSSSTLHDVIGHQVALIRFNLFQLKSAFEKGDNDCSKHYNTVENLIDDADALMNQIRTLSKMLKGDIVYELGLVAGLEILINKFTEKTKLDVEFEAPNEIATFNRITELHIYRIVQEILTNIIKHSKASKLSIIIVKSLLNVTFKVKDNGIGFDVSKVEKKKTLGLIGIRERVKTIGGSLIINSNPGMGTEFIFKVNL